MPKIKVLVCRVGQPPVVEEIVDSLEASQKIVGGYIESWAMGGRLSLICNGEGRFIGLKPNRPVRADHWTGAEIVRGDFFLVSGDGDGGFASLSDAEIADWSKRLELVDTK